MTRRYRYVLCMDYLYRLSTQKYQKLMIAIAEGNEFTMDDYGKQVAQFVTRVTDMEHDEAIDELTSFAMHLLEDCEDCGKVELRTLAHKTATGYKCGECHTAIAKAEGTD